MANWIGHFLMLAPFPFLADIFTEQEWFRISGISFGLIFTIIALYLMIFKARNIRGRLSSVMMVYTGAGMKFVRFVL